VNGHKTQEKQMSFLKNLKIIAAPSKQLVSPEQHRRNKCVVKIAEQIEIAEAELAGKTYERMKKAWVTDANGERKRVERPARIKKWWSKDAAGNAFLRIFYGSKPIELQKGKIAIEVGAIEKLPVVLKAVKEAIVAGELDSEIGLIARERAPKKKLKAA
jgi:hypothetical protein